MRELNIVFMGSADLSVPSLAALLAAPACNVVAAVTQPDRPKGRHLKLTPSPVKVAALKAGLPVLQPERARDEAFGRDLASFSPDLIVVAAYGQILPRAILDLPAHGCINVHTSLLPRYRGAAPIQWALLNGDRETGVTIMKMDAGLDTGDILSQESTFIEPSDNAATLHDRLARLGASLLARTIPDYIEGKLVPRPQPADGVVYAPKIKKQDGEVNWTQPAVAIWNKVRGFTPWPGAYTWLPADAGQNPTRLKLLKCEPVAQAGNPGMVLASAKDTLVIACGQGALQVQELQLEGGRPMSPQQFLSGHREPLTRLGLK